jgi:isocitrate dehydrogenase kinase/phosphatase
MDLNYLYQRHHVSLFMAANGSSDRARLVHAEFADLYAARIAQTRRSRGGSRAA